jgi:hypothetical protein
LVCARDTRKRYTGTNKLLGAGAGFQAGGFEASAARQWRDRAVHGLLAEGSRVRCDPVVQEAGRSCDGKEERLGGRSGAREGAARNK